MYAYNETASSTTEYQGKWPGTNMYNDPVFKLYYEEINPKKDWYYAEIDAQNAKVIFNNNNDSSASTKVQEPDGVGTPGYTVTAGDNWIQNGKVYKTGIVNVRYESTTGELLDAALLKGISNGTDKYQAVAKNIEGYILKTSPSSTTGVYTDTPKTLTYIYEPNVVTYEPLANESTISATSVTAGTKVTLTGNAIGGEGDYTYALMYKKHIASDWIKIGQKYTSVNVGSFTPKSATTYDVRIIVKDESGKTVKKDFALEVKAAQKALTNKSTVSATEVTKGTKITLTAKAEGGTAPYTYALMYKKSSSKTWTKIGTKYGTASTGSFKPGSATTYDVMINVKDSTGKVKSKTFTITVK